MWLEKLIYSEVWCFVISSIGLEHFQQLTPFGCSKVEDTIPNDSANMLMINIFFYHDCQGYRLSLAC